MTTAININSFEDELKDISNNIITVRGIEALDGSPILDIKKAIIRDGVIL